METATTTSLMDGAPVIYEEDGYRLVLAYEGEGFFGTYPLPNSVPQGDAPLIRIRVQQLILGDQIGTDHWEEMGTQLTALCARLSYERCQRLAKKLMFGLRYRMKQGEQVRRIIYSWQDLDESWLWVIEHSPS